MTGCLWALFLPCVMGWSTQYSNNSRTFTQPTKNSRKVELYMESIPGIAFQVHLECFNRTYISWMFIFSGLQKNPFQGFPYIPGEDPTIRSFLPHGTKRKQHQWVLQGPPMEYYGKLTMFEGSHVFGPWNHPWKSPGQGGQRIASLGASPEAPGTARAATRTHGESGADGAGTTTWAATEGTKWSQSATAVRGCPRCLGWERESGFSFWVGSWKWWYIWVFPKIVIPPKHPRIVIFSTKTNSCWVPPF